MKGVQPCYWAIEQLPGLSDRNRLLLQKCGITTTAQLLQSASTATTKQTLARRLEIHPQYVEKWFALADLARIPSVGCQYCGLLLHAGIASVSQLAQMPAHKLHQQILRLQVATMQRRDLCPAVEDISNWIQQARQLGHQTQFSKNQKLATNS